jgi:hypothetical protein
MKRANVPHSLPMTPGRRLALALGLPFALACAGYAGLNYVSLVAQAKYSLGPTVLAPAQAVVISDGSGDATVRPSTDGRAHLRGEVNYSLVRSVVTWKTQGKDVVVTGPDCFWIGSCGSDLHLSLPGDEALRAELGDGNLDVEGLRANLRLSDSSGDITVGRVSGTLALSDSSGNISGARLESATVTASDSSGDIKLQFDEAPDKVVVHDASGNITVAVPGDDAYRVIAETASGSKNVDVPTNPSSQKSIDVYDDSGNVDVVPTKG